VRIALAVHAWPAEGAGGVERSVRALAGGLARAGHEVSVLAGSLRRAQGGEVELRAAREDLGGGASCELVELRRPDLHFDHWHKSRSPAVAARLRELLAARAVEVLHVHHWLRLSRDLVHAAARAGVPSVVSLHDAWTSCALAFRVRSRDGAPCDAPAGPDPCVACAGRVPPHTPWVDTARGWMALAERQRDLVRELRLARAVTAPTAAHAAALEPALGLGAGALAASVLAPARAPLEEPRARATDVPGRELRLVAWGAHSAVKGQDLVLEALRTLGNGSLALHGAGEADWTRRLRDAAQGLQVRFEGPCEPELLAERGAALAHAFVSGTRALESYGLVLDEAWELGLPVVVPDAPAFRERCGPLDARGTGPGALLYARGDARALAAALARLRDEPGLWARLAEQARARAARARAATSPERSARAHLALYEAAIARGAPRVEAPQWFEERLAAAELAAWDEACARAPESGLGSAT
jgi:glycosyltransferase involved in cell wall biosynthesis